MEALRRPKTNRTYPINNSSLLLDAFSWTKDMQWGISPNAPAKEQIKADFEGIIRGLNCVGEIDYFTYSKLFEEIMPLFDQMHEQGKKDALKDAFTWHKFPDEMPPRNDAIYLVTLIRTNNQIMELQTEVRIRTWRDKSWIVSTDTEVVAWAEIPKPELIEAPLPNIR
jgi:hypothetical protein